MTGTKILRTLFRGVLPALLMLAAAPTLAPQAAHAAAPATLAAPAGATLVPEHYLRRWDPVTLFFRQPSGPAAGGAEHHPDRFVTLQPAHPGVYTWLDHRTLQFRPADPWPPLTRFTWRFDDHQQTLATLFEPPVASGPADGSRDLDPVQSITLAFNQPMAAEALAEMVRIELRPLPGVSAEGAQWLDRRDFDVKVLDRAATDAPANYVLQLHRPIPAATLATLHLRLSLDDRAEASFTRIEFATAEPFTASRLGCAGASLPLSAEGVRYDPGQALRCPPRERELELTFTAPPEAIDPLQARNLLRFAPAVDGLTFRTAGHSLLVAGDFLSDTLYQVTLHPTALHDARGRPLVMKGASTLHLFFPRRHDFLRWDGNGGILERFGPQMLPLEGRGEGRVDLRIYPVDPYDRSFWPFPGKPVVVDENRRPPGPGEAAEPYGEPGRAISARELGEQIAALGSPPISTLVELPLRRDAGGARFGLDLKPYLARLAGGERPGSYLVGLRRLGEASRSWVRVQVTDLALTTVEERERVHFYLTSLASGEPLGDGRIRIEGHRRGNGGERWETLAEGRTDGSGHFAWDAPGLGRTRAEVRRIVVERGDDRLVLDPSRPPQRFAKGRWDDDHDTWLQWAFDPLDHRTPPAQQRCHLFTERPVYRPEEPVHIAGWMRSSNDGRITPTAGDGELVIDGPGNAEWRYPLTLSASGGLYHKFTEKDLPTGRYSVTFHHKKLGLCGRVNFTKEAYRLPRFEVTLNGPRHTALDAPFKLLLNARYYAGGQVADRPVRWRVTQFPYRWTPQACISRQSPTAAADPPAVTGRAPSGLLNIGSTMPSSPSGPRAPSQRGLDALATETGGKCRLATGFVYSTDSRYGGSDTFRATPRHEEQGETDAEGMAELALDPTIETTAQPRRYVVESTVTGADDQTVSATHEVLALPPFVLGMKLPRYLERAEAIEPAIIVVGPDGQPLAGQAFKLRLLHRQWHSHLRAADFSRGDARYVTEEVETPLFERTYRSGAEALAPSLPIDRSGVYVVELEARDRLGRTQVLRLDLFAGGDQPVTWARPPARTFSATPARSDYAPGDEAEIVLESPFQNARALAIVEEPDGRNRYQWLDVRNGTATFRLTVRREHLPRLPVHFVLLRGRLAGAPPRNDALDLGKPATLATTAWIRVNDAAHRIDVALEYPEKARPGDEVEVAITLRDRDDRPLAGEVALWLVDQAVLALGQEQRLDPLPDFIPSRESRTTLHDTRNLTLGHLPLRRLPGGDGAMNEMAAAKALLDKVSPRRNFQPVPYFAPAIRVGDDGRTVVKVKLPDNLTNFSLRAKAVSGNDRFGFAEGRLAVRLPVIVQPSLPRFVRPGDRFNATAIGRIVDGDGGPGEAAVDTEGLKVDGAPHQSFKWDTGTPQRIDFRLTVPTPEYDEEGRPTRDKVSVKMAVERSADHSRDAFAVTLPLLPDRRPRVRRQLAELAAGETLTLPALDEEVRPGTLRRTLLLSDQPALVRMAAGLHYLMEYPHGCTEQRLSRARVQLGSGRLDQLLQQPGDDARRRRDVEGTIDWIARVVHDDGTVGYWPGSEGYLSLTAWSAIFLLEARDAGFTPPPQLLDRLLEALRQSLRSDYRERIFGGPYRERVWALTALARAGRLDAGYAAELVRRADSLDLESVALLRRALSDSPAATPEALRQLDRRLWDGVVLQLYQGHERYAGLQETASAAPREVLPSETRTLAQLLRAEAHADDGVGPADGRQLLLDALVTLGRGDGWGSTNANAAALLALGELLESGSGRPVREVALHMAERNETLQVGGGQPLQRLHLDGPEAIELQADSVTERRLLSVQLDTRYLPAAPGSEQRAEAAGFVIRRELELVRDAGEPPTRVALEQPGMQVPLTVGQVVEEHVELVNPEARHFVAVVVPLAAGMEPLNTALATAPPEATPSAGNTLAPAYTAFLDDRMAYYYDALPKGTYHFHFRTRATIPGAYTQPAPYAEMMYREAVRADGNGARILITAEGEKQPPKKAE